MMLTVIHAIPVGAYLFKCLAHRILPCRTNELMEWVWCWHPVCKIKDMEVHNKKGYRLRDFLLVLIGWLTVISLVYVLIIRLQ